MFTKLKKKNVSALGILVMKIKDPIYLLIRCFEEKHYDLLLRGEEGKRHCAFFKNFNIFMHQYALYR